MYNFTEKECIFDAIGAEAFHAYFNDCIMRYGFLTVSDLFTNPLLLGDCIESKDGIPYFFNTVGWNRTMPMTEMFRIKEEKGMFLYVLELPLYRTIEKEAH